MSPSSSSRPRSRAGSTAATTPRPCVDIVLKSDAALPKGHQTWQLNEVNGIIWPAPNGIGITDAAAFDRTVQVALDGGILTKPVEGTAWRNDLAEAALAELVGPGHQGRVLDQGGGHPHRGRQVGEGASAAPSAPIARSERPALPRAGRSSFEASARARRRAGTRRSGPRAWSPGMRRAPGMRRGRARAAVAERFPRQGAVGPLHRA